MSRKGRRYEIRPLTAERWSDLEALFGPRGAAYPTNPRGKRLAAVSSFTGLPSVLERAGFREMARPSEARVIMRKRVRPRPRDR